MARLLRTTLLHVFSILFGIGSWVTINGVWVQLPQLVLHQPEGWALSSYIAVIVQAANIGPITYSIVDRVVKSTLTDVISVIVTTTTGSASCLLLSFFWNKTIYFVGQFRSIPLLILVFLMSLVDCTSSVLFLPFMATFKDKYLTSFLVGEGLSGLLPSVLALIQDVGTYPECIPTNTTVPPTIGNQIGTLETKLQPVYPEPRFSTGHFFILLFVMDVLSLLAFLLLTYLPLFKCEKVVYSEQCNGQQVQNGQVEPKDEMSTLLSSGVLTRNVKYYLYVLQGWLSALSNGVFTAIPTYSCLPYGNKAFLLAITLSTMANPLACCVAYFYPIKKVSIVNILVILGTLISCYLMVTAVLSPTPPLVNTTVGEILIVVTWILFVGLFSNAKANVAGILRTVGKRALFWYGVWTQIGSSIGAIIMFVLINNYGVFKTFNPCD